MALREFIKSAASLSVGLTVFGISQSAKVFRGLPTPDPTETANASNNAVLDTIKEQYDSGDTTIFNVANAVPSILIDLAFDFFQPNTFNPTTIAETTQNVGRGLLGLAAQLIPGGRVGSGGLPEGWGPVNNKDAKWFT